MYMHMGTAIKHQRHRQTDDMGSQDRALH